MTLRFKHRSRPCPAPRYAIALCALVASFCVGGCSSRHTYTPPSSSSYSASQSNFNSNAGSSYASNTNYNVNAGSSYGSMNTAVASGAIDISQPLAGTGVLTSTQVTALNALLRRDGQNGVTGDELLYLNVKLLEEDDRPTLREVRDALIQYRIDNLKAAIAQKLREIQSQPRTGTAPSYGGAPAQSYPSQMYHGLSESEKQSIWSRELPRDTQEERKAKVEPYSQNSNNR